MLEESSEKSGVSLRENLSAAVSGAIAKLVAEANAFDKIEHENQLRACIALARLAPALLEKSLADEENEFSLPPDLTPERANELLDNLERARAEGDGEQNLNSSKGA